MRAFAIAVSVCLSGLGLVAPAGAAEPKTYTAALAADQETPAPGPSGGTGTATITVDLGAKTLCYYVTWSKEVGTPNGGHLHKGAMGTNGPVVAGFDLPAKPKDCVTADRHVLGDIMADPAGHYVNLHTEAYPGGAVRGQLAASS